MGTYLYYRDLFKPVSIDVNTLLELAEDKPLELFELIRGAIESELGRIYDVRVYGKYFDPKDFDIVVEFLVRCSIGEVSLKIIHSKNPAKALEEYYAYEKRIRR